MRGVKYLTAQKSKPTEKTRLWASTLYLFHRYKGYVGPFYSAGYRNYRIQNEIMRNRMTYASVDIIAWDEKRKRGCSLELTTNPNCDKNEQLDRHHKITCEELAQQIAITVDSPLDTVLVSNYEHQTDFCQIVVDTDIYLLNTQKITDEILKKELEKPFKNNHFPPQPRFTMDPEPNNYELCNGLITPIMKMIYNGERKTAEEMVKEALDIIYDNMSFESRTKIIKLSTEAIDDLMTNYLYNVIKKDNDVYYVDSDCPHNSRRFKSIGNGIKNWTEKASSRQTRITEWF